MEDLPKTRVFDRGDRGESAGSDLTSPDQEIYLGLDLYHLHETSRVIGTRARGAYWLTFLGQPLLGQLGGTEALRQKLPFPGVSFLPLEGDRLLITLSGWPEAIDTEEKLHPAQYFALAHLLEPFFCEERTGWSSLDKDPLRRWMRRLCQ